MSKQTDKLFVILSKVFCLCFLLALVSTNSLFARKTNELNDLVYCPLQKTWIKQSVENLPIHTISLDQICMNDKEKRTLSTQILLKKAFAIDEKGIFETLRFGVKILNSYRNFPSSPNQNLAENRHTFSLINSKNNWLTDFQINTQAFSFQQFSRPPTLIKSTKFNFQIAQTLEKISRNINPRSPPIFS